VASVARGYDDRLSGLTQCWTRRSAADDGGGPMHPTSTCQRPGTSVRAYAPNVHPSQPCERTLDPVTDSPASRTRTGKRIPHCAVPAQHGLMGTTAQQGPEPSDPAVRTGLSHRRQPARSHQRGRRRARCPVGALHRIRFGLTHLPIALTSHIVVVRIPAGTPHRTPHATHPLTHSTTRSAHITWAGIPVNRCQLTSVASNLENNHSSVDHTALII
jgi:hypothetical protein